MDNNKVNIQFVGDSTSSVSEADKASKSIDAVRSSAKLAADEGGASFTTFKAGLASVAEASDFMSSAISAATGVLAGLGIGFSLMGVVNEIESSIEAIDTFNLSVIQMSAILTSLQIANGSATGSIADTYRQTRDYALQTNEALLKIEPSTSLSIKGLQRINLELSKAGVAIDTNNAAQVEGFKNLANAAAVFSQGGQNEVMLQSEIMLLMQGQASAHSRLGSAISAMVGGDLKTWVEQHKQAGDFLEQMNKVLAGFGPASKDIAGTWSAVKTSFETTVNIIQRGAMQEVFAEVVNLTKQINENLQLHTDDIVAAVHVVEDMATGMAYAAGITTIYTLAVGVASAATGGLAAGAGIFTAAWTALTSEVSLSGAAMETVSIQAGMMGESVAVASTTATVGLTSVKTSLGVLGAAFAGWEIGTFLNKFETVRQAGVVMVYGIMGAWHELETAWARFKVTANPFGNEEEQQASLGKITNDYNAWLATFKANFAEQMKDAAKDPTGPMPAPKPTNVRVPNVKQKTPVEDDDGKYAKQVKSAHDAYLEYLKAYGEEQAAVVKTANALLEESNKESYEWGLMDLQTYLATKHKLNEAALQAELDAKKTAYAQAQSATGLALTAFGKDPTGDTAKGANEAYKKEEAALKAVTEAQGKLGLAKLTDADETKKLTDDQLRGYQSIQAQLLDVQGQYVAAALIQKGLDESSKTRQALITEAMKGTAGAEAAYWAQEALDQKKFQDAVEKGATERRGFTLAEISNQMTLVDISEKYYLITTGDAAKQRIDLLNQQLIIEQGILDLHQGSDPKEEAARNQAIAQITSINEKLLAQQKILADTTPLGGAISSLQAFYKSASDLGGQVGGAVTNLFKGMTDALTTFVTKGKVDFKSFADSIIADLVRIVIQQNITGPLAAGVSGLLQGMFSPTATQGVPSSISATSQPAYNTEFSFLPTAQAMGGAWDRGVQKFADGGVVLGPTSFQTASGAGLMGEAGPEAIMPLTRTASGALGVQLVGGQNQGGAGVTVNIVNNTGSPMSASQSSPKFDQAKGWVIGVVVENIAGGGVLRTMMQGGS